MARRIDRMRRRTFGECLRKKVIPISIEAALHGQRVKNIVVHVPIEGSPVASQNLANDGTARFGSVTEMDEPLLVPNVVYRKASNSRDRRRKVGSTKGAKAVLRPGSDVRITRVRGRTDGAKHHISREVGLIEDVHTGICAETASIT